MGQATAAGKARRRGWLPAAAALALGLWPVAASQAPEVLAWGWNAEGQCDPPPEATNLAAIAAGRLHSLALRADGTVVVWGDNSRGQCDPPAGLSQVRAIAAGEWHNVALRADGAVVAWGWDRYGQCDPPEGLQGVAAIAAGGGHSLALLRDGTVVAWGNNQEGQCDPPPGATNLVAIAAGSWHSLGLRADGTVIAWGWNDNGQCDPPATLRPAATIAAGGLRSWVVQAGGLGASWGWRGLGLCNAPPSASGLTAVSAGWDVTLGLRESGRLVARGGLGVRCEAPTGAAGVAAVAAGDYHALALVPRSGRFFFGEAAVRSGERAELVAPMWEGKPVTTEWLRDGQPAETGPTFLIEKARPADSGEYTAVSVFDFGRTTNAVIRLQVAREAALETRNFRAPPAAAPGGALCLSWTTVNLGEAALEEGWTVRVFLSADSGQSLPVAVFHFSEPLLPGESRETAQTAAAPVGLDPGREYWWTAETEWGQGGRAQTVAGLFRAEPLPETALGGRSVALAGNRGGALFSLSVPEGATQAEARLQLPEGPFRDWAAAIAGGCPAKIAWEEQGQGVALVRLTPCSGGAFSEGRLCFGIFFTVDEEAAPGFAAVKVLDAAVYDGDGNKTEAAVDGGGTAVAGAAPLLEARLDSSGAPVLTLYGAPGGRYQLLRAERLDPEAPWIPQGFVDLEKPWTTLPLPTGEVSLFFRAAQEQPGDAAP